MNGWVSAIKDSFIELFELGYKILTAKDPCKKCIVQACCSIDCEEKRKLRFFLQPFDTVRGSKLYFITSVILLSSNIGLVVYAVLKALYII